MSADAYWWVGFWTGAGYFSAGTALLIVLGAAGYLAVDNWRWRKAIRHMDALRKCAAYFPETNRDN